MLQNGGLVKPLTPEQLKKIQTFPQYTGICPTCNGEKTFTTDGVTHDCDCKGQLELQRRYFAANIGSLYHIIHFDDFFDPEGELADTVRDYVDAFEDNLYYGRGITFDGDLGTGKTFAAIVILKELVKKGYDGYFITFDDLLNVQSRGWDDLESNKEFYRIRDADILVVDELFDALEGTKKKELLADTLERIVRYRVSNRMPTIITTNLKPEQEARAYPRVSSLLATNQIRCRAPGDDMRKNKVRKLTSGRIARGDRKAIV
jgi:DNA replication protein DnaC